MLQTYHKGCVEGINISAESFFEDLIRSFLVINILEQTLTQTLIDGLRSFASS